MYTQILCPVRSEVYQRQGKYFTYNFMSDKIYNMEFGRVPEEELKKIDFTLPAEPVENKKILKGKPASAPKLYIGCAKWDRPDWIGKIYPPKTREKDFLQHYVQHYNCVELNATHYKVYGVGSIRRWAEKAKGRDFLFCPKMYKGVTHSGNMQRKTFLSNEFLRGVVAFKEHLGPIFIQVNETFSPKRQDELFTYLRSLPTDLQFFLEVRHRDWFAKEKTREELFGFLTENNIGAIITDTSGRRDCAHMRLSIPKTFIRFVGNSLHPTDYSRIDKWVHRMKYWLSKGIGELFFVMHMHEEATSPELNDYLIEKIKDQIPVNTVFRGKTIGEE